LFPPIETIQMLQWVEKDRYCEEGPTTYPGDKESQYEAVHLWFIQQHWAIHDEVRT
jgi:hypothetical protein